MHDMSTAHSALSLIHTGRLLIYMVFALPIEISEES